MYYDIEEEARHREPDIDEELQKLEDCKALATQIYESSEKTKEDYEKYNYKLLAIAENKNRLLEKKILKKEIETGEFRTSYFELLEKSRFLLAEKLFLCLLCGFSTTIFLPVPDILTFVFQVAGSFLIALFAAILTLLFPKRKNFIGSFYDKHPFICAIIYFIILAAIITIIKNF